MNAAPNAWARIRFDPYPTVSEGLLLTTDFTGFTEPALSVSSEKSVVGISSGLQSVTQTYICRAKRMSVTPRREDAKVLGVLLNAGSNLMRDGIERIVNGLEAETLGGSAAWREQGFRSEL